ncbi:hypothetical protein [Proteiniphilum acetatigenes]|uniref:hypothetical protein n=1 Tax=Proteiniphilum acetatigenes TaxID=294710 RepID=UPI00036CD5EA|nr:hypothetical protein [Proteiniphilum acetatigenes]
MKKIFYLMGISALFLVTSCNNDEIPQSSVPEAKKTYLPTIQGNLGKFIETTTRAGVVEENDDPVGNGENFYWSNEDQVKLLFYKDGILENDPIEIIYQAVVEGNEKPNRCEFVPVDAAEGLEEGSYTVYGLYPASGWTLGNVTGPDGELLSGEFYKATMVSIAPIENEESSSYLTPNIFMKAKATDVVIGDEGSSTPISLQYKQLGGILRIHLRNENQPLFPKLSEFQIAKVANGGEGGLIPEDLKPFFNTQGYLQNIDDEALTPATYWQISTVTIDMHENVSTEFDFFIPILATDPFEGDDVLYLRAIYVNSENEEMDPAFLRIFPSTNSVLQNGFKAGKSYYFNLTGWS